MKTSKWRFIVVTLLVWMFIASLMTESTCIYRATLGIPCPGCGMTRAFVSLLGGHFAEAFAMNPLWPLVVLACLLMAYLFTFKKTQDFKRWLLTKLGTRVSLGVLILVILVYCLRMILLFPHTEPMTFNEKALWPQMYKFFIIHLP